MACARVTDANHMTCLPEILLPKSKVADNDTVCNLDFHNGELYFSDTQKCFGLEAPAGCICKHNWMKETDREV